jgi:hypothetical protein
MKKSPAGEMKISSVRHLVRRDNLALLVDEFKSASGLAEHVGTPKSHISALLAGARGIGDTLANKLERKCEKPPGWMDDSHPGSTVDDRAEATENAASGTVRLESALAVVAAALKSIPLGQRDAVSRQLGLLALAPDSQDLLTTLVRAIRGEPSERDSSQELAPRQMRPAA